MNDLTNLSVSQTNIIIDSSHSSQISQTDIEKVLSILNPQNISVYTNEFDLMMVRVFSQKSVSKIGYLSDSCSLSNILTEEIAKNHKISISRSCSDLKLFSQITTEGSLFIHYLDGDPLVPKIIEEPNEIIRCEFINSMFPIGHNNTLKITTVGKYSITSSVYSKQLCKMIKDRNINPKIIFDATGCIGGDTIGFSMYLKCKVICMEKDPVNFTVLQNNILAYNLQIESFLGDFTIDGYNIIKKYEPDVVYFDPPWGGKDYDIQKNIELYLSGKNIKEIVYYIFDTFECVKNIIIKVPCNFNLNGVNSKFDLVKMKKFNVVFLTRKENT